MSHRKSNYYVCSRDAMWQGTCGARARNHSAGGLRDANRFSGVAPGGETVGRGGRQSGSDRSVAIEKRITARHRERPPCGSQCRSHVTILFELCRDGPFLLASSRPLHIPHCSPSLAVTANEHLVRSDFGPRIGHARSTWCKRGDRAREERAEIVVRFREWHDTPGPAELIVNAVTAELWETLSMRGLTRIGQATNDSFRFSSLFDRVETEVEPLALVTGSTDHNERPNSVCNNLSSFRIRRYIAG